MRLLTILSGVLMALTGVFCFMNPGQTFLAVAFIIGLVMILNGVVHILGYLIGRGLHNKGDNNGWILVDALITLLLGILVICNQLVADTSIHMVFGMWVLVTGILRIEAATHINIQNKKSNFVVTLGTGIVTTIIGLFGFVNPLVSILTTLVLLGLFMVMQGINIIELGINMPHEKKTYVRMYKKKREAVKITDEEETPEAVALRIQQREAQKEAEEMAKVEVKDTTGEAIGAELNE